MGLINLKTDLKSLRYGNDRIGGGNSGQPYIKTNIPDNISPYIGTTDFLLRGGINAVKDSATDIVRLTKMFFDTKSPNGLLFIAKQQLLSQTAVRTQTSGVLNEGIYSPLNTLAQAGVIAFGGHLDKQGNNPFEETGAYANNKNLYQTKVPYNQPIEDNRLARLYKSIKENLTSDKLDGFTLNNGAINVLTYNGGPNAISGKGQTNIRFASPNQRTGDQNPLVVTNPGYFYGTLGPKTNPDSTKYTKTLSLINDQSKNKGVSGIYSKLTSIPVNNNFNFFGKQIDVYNHNVYDSVFPKNSPLIYNNGTFTYTQKDIIDTNINLPNGINPSPKSQDFRQVLRDKLGVLNQNGKMATESGATPFSPSYNIAKNQTIEGRVNLGDPGARANKSYASYSKGVINTATNSPVGALDKLTALPLYRSEKVSESSEVNDLVKFRIAVIDNNSPNFKTFIHFRAFLDSMSDSYTGNWNSFQYLGRAENFYTYNGFNRSISLGWTVFAQSKEELIPMYKKLNYLASTTAPDYSPNGYMRGVLVQLTVGGYLYEQPGFITSLSYDLSFEAPWEIGIGDGEGDGIAGNDPTVKELPHMIKVTGFNFTPIHRFVPQLQKNNYSTIITDKNKVNQETGPVNSFGPQRFIALEAITNNYDS
jgi:hypothetical protein